MSANPIFVLQYYRFGGIWFALNLYTRTSMINKIGYVTQFAMGVPEFLEEAAKQIPNAEEGFRLLFSALPFPQWTLKVKWVRGNRGGNWYTTEDGREGWFCNEMLVSFETAPKEIYMKLEPF